jgi:hypothetical protein
MANRVWEPLDWPAFDGTGEAVTDDEITSTIARGAAAA